MGPSAVGGWETFPLVTTPMAEQQGPVSPDGRWLAYNADQGADGPQLFLRPFPLGR